MPSSEAFKFVLQTPSYRHPNKPLTFQGSTDHHPVPTRSVLQAGHSRRVAACSGWWSWGRGLLPTEKLPA